MASIPAMIPTLLLSLLLLLPHCSIADHHSPELSPAPAPFPGDLASAPFEALSLPSPPSSSSPFSDPSPDLAPHYPPSSPFSASFPTPAAEPDSSTFSTPPFDLIDVEDQIDLQSRASENEYSSGDGSGGMTGGRKASVAIASVAGVAVVGMGALVYKKRRDNIRRARYGYATRRDLL